MGEGRNPLMTATTPEKERKGEGPALTPISRSFLIRRRDGKGGEKEKGRRAISRIERGKGRKKRERKGRKISLPRR